MRPRRRRTPSAAGRSAAKPTLTQSSNQARQAAGDRRRHERPRHRSRPSPRTGEQPSRRLPRPAAPRRLTGPRPHTAMRQLQAGGLERRAHDRIREGEPDLERKRRPGKLDDEGRALWRGGFRRERGRASAPGPAGRNARRPASRPRGGSATGGNGRWLCHAGRRLPSPGPRLPRSAWTSTASSHGAAGRPPRPGSRALPPCAPQSGPPNEPYGSTAATRPRMRDDFDGL